MDGETWNQHGPLTPEILEATVTIHEVGEIQPGEKLKLATGETLAPGTPFIAMELIDGKPLNAVLEESGVTPADIDTIQFYDSFTITVLVMLEDCGFCAKGEGGPFVAEGHLKRGGRLPMNTDGGGLSASHSGMRGIFLLIEAVRQLRGQGGEAQVPNCELALCAGSGGYLSCIGTVILGRE